MKAYTKEIYYKSGYQVPEKIYTLKNPLTDEVFYIGRTRKPLSDRLWGHIAAAKGKGDKFRNSIKDAHVLYILANGGKPVIHTVETIQPISYIEYLEIAEREIFWMKYFKENGSAIMNIMGLKVIQPNAKYLWYLDCKERNAPIPVEYYYCGVDKTGVNLYHKERIIADGMKWEDDFEPKAPIHRYNPFNNPLWKKKMGFTD